MGNIHPRHISYQLMTSMLHSSLPIAEYCFLFTASQAVTLLVSSMVMAKVKHFVS